MCSSPNSWTPKALVSAGARMSDGQLEELEASAKSYEDSSNNESSAGDLNWSYESQANADRIRNYVKAYKGMCDSANDGDTCGEHKADGPTMTVAAIYEEDFAKFDADGDGFLRKEEVEALLQFQMGKKPTSLQLEQYFDELDLNEDGKVSLEEYVASVEGKPLAGRHKLGKMDSWILEATSSLCEEGVLSKVAAAASPLGLLFFPESNFDMEVPSTFPGWGASQEQASEWVAGEFRVRNICDEMELETLLEDWKKRCA